MTCFEALLDGIQQATDAFIEFTIVAVDEATPAIEALIVAMLPWAQWAEMRRMANGEIDAFGFREIGP